MAIQKEKTLESGAVGNYWSITSIYINTKRLNVIGTIALYKNQEFCNTGKPPLGLEKKFTFPLDVAAMLAADNVIAYTYNKIIAEASVQITHDILGNQLTEPIYVDADLVGGTMV